MSATVAQFNLCPHGDEQVTLGLNVTDVRNVFEDYRLFRQDGSRHRRKRSILGPTYAYCPNQRVTAANYEFVHEIPKYSKTITPQSSKAINTLTILERVS